MIRFAVVGTNWVTEHFIDAAYESGKLTLSAVYSHRLEQARTLGANYHLDLFFDDLMALAQSDATLMRCISLAPLDSSMGGHICLN